MINAVTNVPEPVNEPVLSYAPGTPELYIAERSFRFPNVVAGQSVTHDFVRHNRGSAPLAVTKVKTG